MKRGDKVDKVEKFNISQTDRTGSFWIERLTIPDKELIKAHRPLLFLRKIIKCKILHNI